jgi:hypothetical protein
MTRLFALVGFVLALAAGAAHAQFDPAFNHLECFTIRPQPGQRFTARTVDVETQFGVHVAVIVRKPHRLCLPARKTGGGVDPLPATAVPHFLCYKVKLRYRERHVVELTDQFGALRERTSKPQLLCAPAVKSLL